MHRPGALYVKCVICESSARFHCNTCGDELCDKCRINHVKSNAGRNHTVVWYHERSSTSVKEMCRTHPTFSYDMCCSMCEVPVCSRCIKENHQGHTFEDTEVVYRSVRCRSDIGVARIRDAIFPICQKILGDVKNDVVKCQKNISEIRQTMKTKADVIKDIVDYILSENLELLDDMENTLISELQHQEKNMSKYMDTLHRVKADYEQEVRSPRRAEFILAHSHVRNLKEIPELPEVNFPSFTEGQIKKDEIAKMFGKIEVPSSNPSFRDASSPNVIINAKLSPKAEKIFAFDISMLQGYCYHISCLKTRKAWLSNQFGRLMLLDIAGNELSRLETTGEHGYHTVTGEDALLFADKEKKCINRVTSDMHVQTFINTDTRPLCVFSSRLNGDIITGLTCRNDKFSKDCRIVRYRKDGVQIDTFSLPRNFQPHFIVENRNCDIVISDEFNVKAFDAKGNPRFTYTCSPPGSRSEPWGIGGIGTDILGCILICDLGDHAIHILDKDGKFLSYLTNAEGKITDVTSIGIDNEQNAWLTTCTAGRPQLVVYKYLQYA